MTPLVTEPQELTDARESLSYWEQRAQRLPMRAVRERREARVLARRWSARVADAERTRYGAGLVGALLIVLFEGRLPEPTRQAGRRVACWTGRTFAAATVAILSLAVMTMLAAVAVVAAIVGALT